MEKRVVVAIVLSLAIIITFQYFTPKHVVVPAVPGVNVVQEKQQAKEAAPEIANLQELRSIEKETIYDTEKYTVSFSNIGGGIRSIHLKDYKDIKSGLAHKLVMLSNPKDYLFAISSSLIKLPLDTIEYRLEESVDGITYSARLEGYEITKRYIFSNNKYGIELEMEIKNLSNNSKEFSYKIIGGSGLVEGNDKDKSFVEVTGMINGKTVGFKRPKEGTLTNIGLVSWTALKDKYFSVILKPMVATKNQFYRLSQNDGFVMGIETDSISLEPGSKIVNKYILYAGPGNIQTLKEFGYDLEETVNYGFFGSISKLLIFTMRSIYNVVHNWGVAIILLSIILNIVLFPLTVKSFKSMQKMQELHPQMEKLKIQHKDNPQKLNKEIMELYKKYKINPLGGCLPMLLQMPIFIALYSALMRSIELRGATFLWINDLSMPDAVPLPATFPIIGDSLNILPLIMIVAMVVQQKMSTKTMGSAVTDEQKQQQKMMLIVMPIVFGFIFYSMPSGLVLYWIVNTVLTISEQYLVLKKV